MAAKETSAQVQEEHANLVKRLDELYEDYLGLLDEYTKTRDQLSAALSKGFMSLAQANFTSPNRTRYGQDHYDDRMQASKTINIVSDIDIHVQLERKSPPQDEEDTPAEKESEQSTGEEDTTEAKKVETVVDPLKWFGVLVPPALRAAQGCFTDALDGSIAQLVSTDKAMEQLEIEIRRTKKRITRLSA